ISPEIRAFCAEHDPVLLGTGAAVLRGGVDLYGIDMTLDLVERLRDRHPRLGCLWSLIEIVGSSPEYADQLRAEVARRGLGASWLFTPPQKIFYPVYELVDLLVRPTLSDGDALSIREALSLGLPVLASDSAPRPEETIVFRSRDQENYEQRARQTLQQLESVRQRLAHRPADSAVQAEVDLLRVALEGDPSG
ncbi:MAG: glycosyltransferase, partial [Myxococcota bacterium]